MSKSKKLRPADRHITRAECQALIVHTLNEVFGTLAEPTEPAVDTRSDEDRAPVPAGVFDV